MEEAVRLKALISAIVIIVYNNCQTFRFGVERIGHAGALAAKPDQTSPPLGALVVRLLR